jgi:hypothetical protein
MFFSDEFDQAKIALQSGTFNQDWNSLINELKRVFAADGPSANGASSLDTLRKRVKQGEKQGLLGFRKKLNSEADGILTATGDFDYKKPTETLSITNQTRNKAAALKLLRHLYLLRRRGGHKVWICSLPASFSHWPSKNLENAQPITLQAKLNDVTQRFSDSDKNHLANASQEANKWVHKALILLANAISSSASAKARDQARAVVKRWFDDGSVTNEQMDALLVELQAGFKKIAAKLGSGHLVLTDHPEYRGKNLENSEAFVWPLAGRERLEVVYIEAAFFSNNNLLKDLKNWTRILVHELTHLDLGTEDKAYAWEGIKPGPGFSFATAKANAESWAFFCADAAHALTDADRLAALK